MKWAAPIFIPIIFLFSACASLPTLDPVLSVDTTQCNRPFTVGRQQHVHAIAATLPGGKNSLITGITTVSAEQESIHVILMTLEGLVLFEGKIQKDKVNVLRSVSIFSSATFVAGLLNDVRLIFLKPSGVPIEIGRSEQEELVCRYLNLDKSIVDVMINPDGDWRLVQYDAGLHPNRSVSATNSLDRIELKVSGDFGYSLDMRLIQ